MKNKFSPAANTLAVLATRGTSEPVAKLAVTQECILLVALYSIVKGLFTYYKDSLVTLPAGATVYFVASERDGYSYLVFLYADGSSLCSCKDGRNHRECTHTHDARCYEAGQVAGLVDRKELANGVTLYEFESASQPGYTYLVTAKNGLMDAHTHQDCIGYRCSKHGCKHSNCVDLYERDAYATYSAAQDAAHTALCEEYKSSDYYVRTFGHCG